MMPEAQELAGKTALITGPAKGMGRAITLALAGEGADVIDIRTG